MSHKYWKYILFEPFLDTIKDNTFMDMDDIDLTASLNNLTKSAISDFNFSRVDLGYAYDNTIDPLDSDCYGYYFIADVTDKEIQVLLNYMKVYWMSSQITITENFKNPVSDKDVNAFSPANMLNAMRNMLVEYRSKAQSARNNYYKINSKGRATWGDINGSKE